MGTRADGPPAGLSKEARTLWARFRDGFCIDDVGGLFLLEKALRDFDRMRQADALIEKEGLTQVDARGVVRAHPAVAISRDSGAALLSTLKALHLDLEVLHDNVGRPPGG